MFEVVRCNGCGRRLGLRAAGSVNRQVIWCTELCAVHGEPDPMEERNDLIAALADLGVLDVNRAAESYGVSAHRVRQIVRGRRTARGVEEVPS